MGFQNLDKIKSLLGRFLKKFNICTNLIYIFYITAKIAIFATDMLWESCLEFNFEQLSHSMFCKNIASLAVAKET